MSAKEITQEMDGLSGHRRTLAIITVILSVAIAVMDGSIANLALPTIAHDMMATESEAIWIINSYQIAMAICLLPLASYGEIVGYKRIYLTGLVLFTVASFACAVSQTIVQISLARVLQGIGAAGILSVNTALIRFIYPGRLLGRAIGYNALVAGSASALGPTVAGLIMHIASWHWIFLVNVPFGILAFSIGCKALPMNPLSARQFDRRSALLSMAFIGTLLYVIDSIGHVSSMTVTLTSILVTIIILCVLLRVQSQTAPMLPLDLLRIPLFTLSIGTSLCAFAAQTAVFVMLPFYLQNQLGMTAPHAGLIMTTWPVATACTAPFAGRLSDKFSAAILGCTGLSLMLCGLLALLFGQSLASDIYIAACLMLCGIGFGLFQAPNNKTIIGTAPRARTGAASGMLGTGRLIGQTTGASVVALMLNTTTNAYRFVLCGAIVLTTFAVVVSFLRTKVNKTIPN